MIRRRLSVTSLALRVGIVLILLGVVLPYLWVGLTSITPEDIIFTRRTSLLPQSVTIENYAYVFRNTPFKFYLRNSAIVAVCTTLLTVVVAMSAAYSFSRFRFAGRVALLLLLLLIYIFPAILVVMPLYLIMRSLQLLNTYAALILAYTTYTIPFCVWMLFGYFNTIPRDLEEAAQVDGASGLYAFFRIILPLTIPGVVATAIFVFIYSWNEYLFALFFTTGVEVRTLPVGLQNYLTAELAPKWGAINASALITTLPIAIIFMFLQRQLVRGLTGGAIKG